MTIGSIITLIAKPAARPDFCMPRPRIQVAYTIRPATIEGSAVIASTIVRTNRENRPGIWFRYTAQARPSGTVIARAMAIMVRVPSIAWAMPPWVSGSSGPEACMSSVKKLPCGRASLPRQPVKPTTMNRPENSSEAAVHSTTVMTRSRTAWPSSSRPVSTA